jgi:DNA polymerase I-like protein with 3'-5' exonuclease and polymerase domains
MTDSSMLGGRRVVTTQQQLDEIVAHVKLWGAFSFDVETRGNPQRHVDVWAMIEDEWAEKRALLKSSNPQVLARSREVIEQRWAKRLALDPLRNEVFWIGIASRGNVWAIPMGHPNGEVLVPEQLGDGTTTPPPGYRKVLASGKESMAKARYRIPATFGPPPPQLDRSTVFAALEPIFFDNGIHRIGHNIKFDAKSIAKYYFGRMPEGPYLDTQVAQHVINENTMSFTLQALIYEHYKFDPYAKHGKVGKTITEVSFDVAASYVCLDAMWTWLLFKEQFRILDKSPHLKHAWELDIDVTEVLGQMELNGIAVDHRAMKRVGRELDARANEMLRDMAQYVPADFNPSSTLDKRRLLYGKKREGGLGLTTSRKTDGGEPSVDAQALKKLRGKHPVVDILLEYSGTQKLKGTYVDGMAPLLNKGRLHPQFHLHRTDTGRLSSSGPNLQNIPRESSIRSMFIAEPGYSLIVADYDQIELRIMAMFSQDKELLRVFGEGLDIHSHTATLVLGRPPADDEERTLYGKMPNFLMGYGGMEKLLAEKTGITLERATSVVEGYNRGYAGMTKWKQKIIQQAHQQGYVETMYGRRRRLARELKSSDWYEKSRAERQAVNFVVQGTAAEICKDAMVDLHHEIKGSECKLLVQVHDELVLSAPTDGIAGWSSVVEKCMGDGRIMMGVPLNVSAHFAGSWSEAKGK